MHPSHATLVASCTLALGLSLSGCGAPQNESTSVRALSTPYLFDLTQSQVAEIHKRYAPRSDLRLLERQLQAPFDCSQFGDLCPEVGERRAVLVVEGAVQDALRGIGATERERNLELAVADQAEAYLEETMPEEISDTSPYFGTSPSSAPSVCNVPGVATKDGFRVRVTARIFDVLLVSWGRIKVVHLKKRISGKWKRERAEQLEVKGDIFIKPLGSTTLTFPVYDKKDNVKTLGAAAGHSVSLVEFAVGCGGTQIGGSLSACACRDPLIGGGSGGGSGGLEPIDEGDFGDDP